MGRVCFVFKPMPWVLSLDAADIGSNNLCSDYKNCRKAAFGFWVKRLLQQGVAVYLSRAKMWPDYQKVNAHGPNYFK